MPPTKSTSSRTAPPAVDDVDQDQAAEDQGALEDGPLPVGSVVRLPNYHDRYAVIVGYSDPVQAHTERDGNGREVQVEAVPHGHPLLLDLHGTPRQHESGVERL